VVLKLDKGDANLGKRTVKKSKANPNGGLIERSVSVHVSNVNKVAAEAKSE
jgi:large subunit ribosomal protein L24